jgi:hypothetical protein
MPGMNSKPRVQVRSLTRAAPKDASSGNSNPTGKSGFGIDLAEPPIPHQIGAQQFNNNCTFCYLGPPHTNLDRRSTEPTEITPFFGKFS